MSNMTIEAASKMASELELALGPSHPFVLGFAYELDKQAAPEWLKRFVGKQTQEAIPKTQLQQGISKMKMKARLSAVKPQLTPKAPMPHESFPVDRHESHFLTKLDAKRAKGRTEPALAPSV